ncbi:class I SAM-dependent DNA methyltransferase [Peterkaempfera sp. SMS 1(5)a]|uniref:class I SAM-dependent DNA methyltransferase n=1 Tax=Peterkaempfera podocarpi TaxID=3232308 RepID=UPI00366EA428
MKGQPITAGIPEPYAAISDTYDRLAVWACEHWGESPRYKMAAFLEKVWSDHPAPVQSVLEVCCGTGLMLEQLVRRGYAVSGLDRSGPMLAQARTRLGDDVPLVRSELPEIPGEQQYDAVICAAAALNYMPDEQTLQRTFEAVARTVRPGGSFVFDVLAHRMVADRFGTSVWADDLGDLAFIWKFQHHPGRPHTDLDYTQFLRDGNGPDTYTVVRETHRLFALDRDTVRELAHRAGFTDISVYDNYSFEPADDATDYETWTLTRGQAADPLR